MIGVRPGVSEVLADAKYPLQKISFSISPSVGRCWEKICQAITAGMQTARGGFSRPQQEQEARSAVQWFGNHDPTGKRLSQLPLRWQPTTNDNKRMNVLHRTQNEEETTGGRSGTCRGRSGEGRRFLSSLLCKPKHCSPYTKAGLFSSRAKLKVKLPQLSYMCQTLSTRIWWKTKQNVI